MPDTTLHDRALGAYLGLAVGDALGATVEFMTPREIALRYGVHRQIVGGGWLKLPAGEVTDDTTMSLALGQAIVQQPRWSLHAVAQAWVTWLLGGPVDCGNTCRRGIRRFMRDGSLAGPLADGDAGNGALMRHLPVVLATWRDEQAFERWAIEQAHVTHHHPLSDAAILSLGHMVRDWLIDPDTADARMRSRAQALVDTHPVFRFDPYPGRASGYVVDTVQTVLHHVLAYEDFEACLVAVVNQGEDADTTGALAGMLAGARGGWQAIPERWQRALRPQVRHAIEQQVNELLRWASILR